jgi:aminopeptidase YwaD
MKTTSIGRNFLLALLTATLSIAVFSQQTSTQPAPSIEQLREHVTYLASDKLEGRRTGSDGANLAAKYIAGEFARYGLRRSIGVDRPGMSHLEADSPNRYMQEFPYVVGVNPGKDNLLSIQEPGRPSDNLRVGDDWMPLGLSSNGRVSAAAVFVGYGISAAELNYNDYLGTDVTHKIAIALQGTPDGDNPHGQFARYEDVRWKAIAARNAGAKALVVIAREDNFREDRLSHPRYDNSAGDAGLPVIVVSRQAVRRLLLGSTSSDLEVAAREKNNASVNKTPLQVSLSTDLVRREVVAHNVIGILEGSDPVLKNEVIVIGAHYDHLGRGGSDSLAAKLGEIHHGADDNASGVAGVLELARVLAAQKPKPRRTIVFIAFSGEEEGLLGSNYYVNHPVVPLANTIAMINMDMIGRMKNNRLVIGGVGTAESWRELLRSANASERMQVTASGQPAAAPAEVGSNSRREKIGMPIVVGANGQTIVSLEHVKPIDLTLNEDGFGPSDHSSFYAKQIPVLFFWTGTHEDYHKPSDTADKINYSDQVRILNLVHRLINEIDDNDKRPQYQVAKSLLTGRSMGFRVYLGTIPNYADSNEGLLLDGVREDSPAAKAGLKAGDRIVKLAAREVRNVYDYTHVLGEMKAGEEYEVEVVRGSERLTLKIIPAARK